MPATRWIKSSEPKAVKLFCVDHNQVLADIKKHFEVVDNIEDCDIVMLWTDTDPILRGVVNYARNLNKKVFTIQHGRKGSSRYYAPFNEPIYADKILVWGEFDRQRLINEGHDPKRIEVVGTTVFSHLKPRKEHEGVNIVFCPEHWDRPVDENKKVMRELKKLRKIKGVNLITKIIESHNEEDYVNPIATHRDSPNHLGICADILAIADVVVGISESTFELLAQSLDIPVVIMEEWEPKAFGGDPRYTTYQRLISRASKRTTLKNLVETVKDQYNNQSELQKERKEVVVEEGGYGLDTIELIKQCLKI